MQTKEETAGKIVVAVIGLDMPGIVAAVTSALAEHDCFVEEVSQVTLKGQFALIGIVRKPEALSTESVEAFLRERVAEKHLRQSVLVRDFQCPDAKSDDVSGEPYVISIWGRDRGDITATFSKIFASEGINIESLRALPLENGESLQFFEVMMPLSVDRRALNAVLRDHAHERGLRCNIQHRDIFEAIHRVKVD